MFLASVWGRSVLANSGDSVSRIRRVGQIALAVAPQFPRLGSADARKVWSVWNTGRLMECEINALRDSAGEPLGHEVRVYVGGELCFGASKITSMLPAAASRLIVRAFEFLRRGEKKRSCASHRIQTDFTSELAL